MDINSLTTKDIKKICNNHNKILKEELNNSSFSQHIKNKIKSMRYIDTKLKNKNELISKMNELKSFFPDYSFHFNNNVASGLPTKGTSE